MRGLEATANARLAPKSARPPPQQNQPITKYFPKLALHPPNRVYPARVTVNPPPPEYPGGSRQTNQLILSEARPCESK